MAFPELNDADEDQWSIGQLGQDHSQVFLVDGPVFVGCGQTIEVDLNGMALLFREIRLFESAFDGRVAEQSPPPETEVEPGSTVIVSLGEAVAGVTVPNVLGMLEAVAQVQIEGRGLVFVKEIEILSVGHPHDGLVRAQTPVGGAEVAPGSEITVTIGVVPVAVPDVVGLTMQGSGGAKPTIRDAGLTFFQNNNDACVELPAGDPLIGLAAQQSPNPGIVVDPLTRVQVWFGILEGTTCP